jgi:predicted membrane protein
VAHETSRAGRWLAERRFQIAATIAIVEGIFVAVEKDVTKWTIIAIAVPIVLLYFVAGRNSKSEFGHQLSWIAASSQVFAALLSIAFILLSWLIILLMVVLGIVAAIFLYADSPKRQRRP